jgi:hypothetical protein
MGRILFIALAIALVLVAGYLAYRGRKDEEPGAVGAAWALLIVALALAAYAFVNPPSAG